jgi:hypothetical protein
LFRYLLPLLLALAAPCFGQEIKIEGPDQFPAGQDIWLTGILPEGVEENYRWEVIPAPLVPPKELVDRKGNAVLVISQPNSTFYTILLDGSIPSDGKDPSFRARKDVKVGKQPDPGPLPPVPPDPGPTPDPPSPAPIPEPGFRVLIFYEKDDPLPPLQMAILAGEEVAKYLDVVCIDEPDGTSGYRIYDDDADLSNELPVWQKAFQRRPQSLPWVIISNGKTGYEGPLPASPSAFVDLCKKYTVKP